MKMMKRCNHPTCRNLIDSTHTYCEAHTNHDYNEYNRARLRDDKEYVTFYSSSAWRKLRRQAMLRDNFLCVRCLADDIYTEATIGDHIIPTKIDWSMRLELDNIQSLCFNCHEVKTREESL